jgi:hypothetical protein
VVAGTAAIVGIVFTPLADEGFFAIVCFGPIATGLVLAIARRPWRPGAAAWALAGLVFLVTDWIVNDEDVLFHAVLSAVMAALVALGAAMGRGLAGLSGRRAAAR